MARRIASAAACIAVVVLCVLAYPYLFPSDERRVEGLLAELRSGDAIRAGRAADALVEYRELAVAPLSGCLGHPAFRTRQNAADALGQIGPPEALPALERLVQCVADEDLNVVKAAQAAVAEFGDPAVPLLMDLGMSSEEWTPHAVVETFALMGRAMIPVVEPYLSHADPKARAIAAVGTMRAGAPITPELIALAYDASSVMNAAADKTLVDRPDAAVPALSESLQAGGDSPQSVYVAGALEEILQRGPARLEAARSDTRPVVRALAASVAADAGTFDAPALLEAVMCPVGAIRGRAANHLRALGAQVVPQLLELLETADHPGYLDICWALAAMEADGRKALLDRLAEGAVGPLAAESLFKTGDVDTPKSAIELLMYRDPNPWYILASMVRGHDSEMAPTLQGLFSSDDPRARDGAALAAGCLGRAAEELLPELRRLTEDSDALVRETAAWAIAEIEGSAD